LSGPPRGDRAGSEDGRKKGSNRSMDSANDMKAHQQTYGGFTSLLKWSVPLLAILTLLIILIIS